MDLGQLFIDSFFKLLIPGIRVSIPLTILGFSFAMVIAVIVAMVNYADVPVLKPITRFYIWIIRGTPLMVQLVIGYYGLQSMGINVKPFPTAVLVFALNEGAYCAETMRGALESVPYGQIEAGYCVGMNYLQVMRHIVIPQALRTAFPALSNSLISMTKDSCLAANITVAEMFTASQRIAGRTYQYMLLYCEVALIYLLFCTAITWLQKIGEKRLSHYGRRN